jgi:hypothetical protein
MILAAFKLFTRPSLLLAEQYQAIFEKNGREPVFSTEKLVCTLLNGIEGLSSKANDTLGGLW